MVNKDGLGVTVRAKDLHEGLFPGIDERSAFYRESKGDKT